MNATSFTELKATSLIEILNAIAACHEIQTLINDDNIENEQLNHYHAGGLANAVNHLSVLAGMYAEWIAANSIDKQA